MPFKDISYLELWQPFCSAERNHLCYFGRMCYEEQLCEKLLFKRFLIWSSCGPPFGWNGTICAILKEGIMGNIHVKLYEIWTSGSGGDVI